MNEFRAMNKYHGMLADSIKDDIEALGRVRQAEIELWASRLRSIVEAAGPDGWFALALVVAEWNKKDALNGDEVGAQS